MRRRTLLLALCLIFFTAFLRITVFGQRTAIDISASQDGEAAFSSDPAATCVGDQNIRPFVAALNGLVQDIENCTLNPLPTQSTYGNYTVILSNGTPSFSVTVTPFLSARQPSL